MTKAHRLLLAVIVLSLLLVACTAGPNPAVHTKTATGYTAGFWLGLWQGLISPITFIISLFSKTVGIYEVHNSGNWYNFGFMFGVSIIFGSILGGSARARRR